MQSHIDIIKCPNCSHIQSATVLHSIPFSTFIHDCEKCKYVIMESEWNKMDIHVNATEGFLKNKESMDLLAQMISKAYYIKK